MLSPKNVALFVSILLYTNVSSQSLAERLGYNEDDKLLIIHADDLGVSHSENIASFLAMKAGSVNSASVMMPTPWVEEVAVFKREYPEADLGLHLTLTAEWEYLKWRPLAPTEQSRTLVNDKGYFYDNCLDFGKKADPEEAAAEIRAQIELALKLGIQPTHLDTHMGCLVFNTPELFEKYLALGREYKIPVMVSRLFLQAASPAFKEKMTDKDLVLEDVHMASPQDYESGMAAYYEKTLNNLGSGVNLLLLHAGLNNAEMQAMTVNHPEYGADWRQQDFDFFTSAKCAQLIKDNNIKLVTYSQIQKMMYPDK